MHVHDIITACILNLSYKRIYVLRRGSNEEILNLVLKMLTKGLTE
jgi:hypothetical protein